MRELSAPAIAAIADGHVVPVALVEMDLDGGQMLLNHSSLDLVIDGKTYAGTHGLGQVGEVVNASAEMPTLAFSISGAPSDKVALALTEPVQGRAVRFLIALYDNASGAVLATSLRYAGLLNVMSLSDGRDQAVIQVTSEAGVRDLMRPSNVNYTHADQQVLAPGDLAFQYTNQQVEQKVVFPAQSWFIKNKP